MKSVEEVVNELVVYRVQRPESDPREYLICGVPLEVGGRDIDQIRAGLITAFRKRDQINDEEEERLKERDTLLRPGQALPECGMRCDVAAAAGVREERERCLKLAKSLYETYQTTANECGKSLPWGQLQYWEDKSSGVADVMDAIREGK